VSPLHASFITFTSIHTVLTALLWVETQYVDNVPGNPVAKNVSFGHNAFRQSNRPLNTIFQQQQERILTMSTPESSAFAFIVNRHPLPSPYLVHMSRMSKTTKKNLDFFKPNVMYPPRTMNFILKPLLHSTLFLFVIPYKFSFLTYSRRSKRSS
jgi:hypothetical protein